MSNSDNIANWFLHKIKILALNVGVNIIDTVRYGSNIVSGKENKFITCYL